MELEPIEPRRRPLSRASGPLSLLLLFSLVSVVALFLFHLPVRFFLLQAYQSANTARQTAIMYVSGHPRRSAGCPAQRPTPFLSPLSCTLVTMDAPPGRFVDSRRTKTAISRSRVLRAQDEKENLRSVNAKQADPVTTR